MKKTFDVTVEGRLTLEIDTRVFESALSPDWQRQFFKCDEKLVAEYIAYNFFVNSLTLSQIDGFADLPDEYVRLVRQEVDLEAEAVKDPE